MALAKRKAPLSFKRLHLTRTKRSEDYCRRMVGSLLPEPAREFRSLLWAKAFGQCHFIEADGQRILQQFGRGADQLVEAILEEAERPLHYSEIAKRAAERTGKQIDIRLAHNAAATVGLLFGRGQYGLKKHLLLSATEVEALAEIAEDIIADGASDRQWHCGELLQLASERMQLDDRYDKYILDLVLRARANLRRHGRMVWSQAGDNESTRTDIRQAIIATLQQAGRPLRANDIRQRLTAAPGLSQNFQVIAGDPLIRVGPATWGLNDRDVEIKRSRQREFADLLAHTLHYRGRGLHVSEVVEAVEYPAAMLPEAVFSLATLDERMRVNSGQYLFLLEWGEPEGLVYRMLCAQHWLILLT